MDSDRIAGAAQQAKGKVEETTGRLTGDTKLQVEGGYDQALGTVRNTAGSAEDAAKAAITEPRSEVEHLRAEVERLSAEPATPRLDAAARTADCTAPGFLDTRLHYAARLKVVSRRAARASSGLR